MNVSMISIVVISCDKNCYLWDGFFKLMRKYWPHHPLKIVLSTETLSYSDVLVSNSRFKDEDWSSRLYHAICDAGTEYVILMLDDFFIKDFVNEEKLGKYFDIIVEDETVAAISLVSQPCCSTKSSYLRDGLVLRQRFAPYRINAQPTVWRSEYLVNILRKGESPWQFELSGTFRSVFANRCLYAIDRNQQSIIPTDKGWLVIRGVLNEDLVIYYHDKEDIDLFPYFSNSNQIADARKKPRLTRLFGYYVECFKSLGYKRFNLKDREL